MQRTGINFVHKQSEFYTKSFNHFLLPLFVHSTFLLVPFHVRALFYDFALKLFTALADVVQKITEQKKTHFLN